MKRLSLALAALAVVGGAQAATVSFQYGLPITTSTTEITQSGALGLFDTSLGTLTSASLTVFGAAVFQFSVTNNAAQTQLANVTSSTSLFWSSSLAALNTPLSGATINLSFSTGPTNFAPGVTTTFGPSNQTGNSPFTFNDAATLAALSAAGGGTFNLTCQSLSGLTVAGGGGNLSIPQQTQAGCGAQITYTYEIPPPPPPPGVPEPASLALVGLALAGASFASRRRRQG
jgi:hypothetical protein